MPRPKTFATNPIAGGHNLYRSGGWPTQLDRVRRWHGRLRSAATGTDYEDFLYAFFQNCNHLADWVIHDLPGGAARVQKLVAETVELRICRDICNATKHFKLTSPPKVEGGFADGNEYVPEGWPTDHAGFPIFVISGGEKYDSLKLADRCLAAWEAFWV